MPDTSCESRATGMLTPERILDVLRDHQAHLQTLGVRSLGLFSSFGRRTPHAASDLDFLLDLQYPSFSNYMAVKCLLEDLFARPVDLALAESQKPRVRERILLEVLYAEGLSPRS